jgi:Holliday junction resolvasome RuvABC endonuclease subunit
MEKIVNEVFRNVNDREYRVLSYEGKEKKGKAYKHFYKIQFLDTKNEYLEERTKVRTSKCKDLLHIKLMKSKIKQQKLKERARVTKRDKNTLKRFNFDSKTILSLDLSTKSSGWCVGSKTCIKAFGCISQDSNNWRERNYNTIVEIEKLINTYKVDIVFIESTFLGLNSSVLEKLCELRGGVFTLIMKYNCEYEVIMPNTWKHYHNLGVGRQEQKAASIRKASSILKSKVNDDVADSCLLYIYAVKNLIK